MYYLFLLLIIYLSVLLFFFLVLYPRVGLPHGVTGFLPELLFFPSPPPWGWSIGFIAVPRTPGLTPSHLFLPAFPSRIISCVVFPIWPIHALQFSPTSLPSPEG